MGPVQFAAGTASNSNGVWGIAWVFRASASDLSSVKLGTVFGPPGWNGGAAISGSCAASFLGMASTYCVGWGGPPPTAGPFTAKTETGSLSAQIDPANTVPRVASVAAFPTHDQRVRASWPATSGVGSYLVDISPSGSQFCCQAAAEVLPGSVTSVTFSNLLLVPGTVYTLEVISFSADLTADRPLDAPFNLGGSSTTFVAPSAPTGPSSGGSGQQPAAARWGKSLSAVVHGSAGKEGSFLRVLNLRVVGVPPGASVVFSCLSGCSLHESLSGTGTVISRALSNVRVPDGSRIEVRVTKAGYTGFDDRLVLHWASTSHWFDQTILCIPLNSGAKPRACPRP